MLDTIGLRFQPDAVLVGYALNDPEQGHPTYPELLPGPISAAMEWSDFYYLLRALAFRLMIVTGRAPDYVRYVHGIFDTSLPSWNAHVRAIRGIVADARAAGVPVAAVVWPFADKRQGFTPYLFEREQQMAVGEWRAAGVPVLNLYPPFAHDSYDDFALSDADSHPNVRAHRRAAAAVLPFLQRCGLVPGGSGAVKAHTPMNPKRGYDPTRSLARPHDRGQG